MCATACYESATGSEHMYEMGGLICPHPPVASDSRQCQSLSAECVCAGLFASRLAE